MDQPLRKWLAARLKSQRQLLGMTQAVVAERCGICTRYYQKLEKGLVNASLDVALRLARVLAFSLDAYHNETGD